MTSLTSTQTSVLRTGRTSRFRPAAESNGSSLSREIPSRLVTYIVITPSVITTFRVPTVACPPSLHLGTVDHDDSSHYSVALTSRVIRTFHLHAPITSATTRSSITLQGLFCYENGLILTRFPLLCYDIPLHVLIMAFRTNEDTHPAYRTIDRRGCAVEL